MKKIPYLQWLILCDEYGKTEGTKKELIIGIFNKLTSTKFPFHYPKMWFLMKFTGCAGEYISSFSIKGPAGTLDFGFQIRLHSAYSQEQPPLKQLTD